MILIAQSQHEETWLMEALHNPLIIMLLLVAVVAIAVVLVKVGPALLSSIPWPGKNHKKVVVQVAAPTSPELTRSTIRKEAKEQATIEKRVEDLERDIEEIVKKELRARVRYLLKVVGSVKGADKGKYSLLQKTKAIMKRLGMS